MPNVQQPEMRRSGETRLVQHSDGPLPGGGTRGAEERRTVPPDQVSPYGPTPPRSAASREPVDRTVEGD